MCLRSYCFCFQERCRRIIQYVGQWLSVGGRLAFSSVFTQQLTRVCPGLNSATDFGGNYGDKRTTIKRANWQHKPAVIPAGLLSRASPRTLCKLAILKIIETISCRDGRLVNVDASLVGGKMGLIN